MGRKWLGLPWWWWTYGVVLLVTGFWDWPTTFGGWIALAAEVVIVVTGLSALIGWFIPATRPRVVAAWRFVISLPGRFPLRIVRKVTLDSLRRTQRLEEVRTEIATDEGRATKRPLTLPERVERLAQRIHDQVAAYDHLDDPYQKTGEEFDWIPYELKLIRPALSDAGLVFSNGILRPGFLDDQYLTRDEAWSACEALRAIKWGGNKG